MSHGDLAVVERWLDGVNKADRTSVIDLTAADVEIVGPRGVGRGRELLADWLSRAGFSSEVRRWFCGADGRVVVEQEAAWTGPDGSATRARIASAFVVQEERIARFERFDALTTALARAGLDEADEVRSRQ